MLYFRFQFLAKCNSLFFSYVEISQSEKKVMKFLEGNVKISAAFANVRGLEQIIFYKYYLELKAHELVECINPEVRKASRTY